MQKENEKSLPLMLEGKVIHGKGLGRTVGMPTANLCIAENEIPQTGVYATKVKIGERRYGSVTNIGRRPSVDHDKHITVETYIFDFEENIYGETVELEIVKLLRPVQKFQNLEEVRKQVEKDIVEAKKYL